MKKSCLAKRLARQSGLSPAAAADELDQVVHRILSNLKKGQDTPFPGLGKFTPGPDGQLCFKPETEVADGD